MARVYVKNKSNGTTYVYESENYWDREKKQSRSKRICVGKLDDNGYFVPSSRFSKPVPESVAAVRKRGPVPAVHTRRLYYGATYLLEQIGIKLGIATDLKECFPNSYRQMLSIVYYLILEDNASMLRFEKWGETHWHPYGENIPSQRSSELFQSITDESRHHFFALQGKRRLDKEYLAYDISTISSYSQCLKQVQYGKNKENDHLPQINLALVFGEQSNLPFYYRKLSGNIPDVVTLKTLLADLKALGYNSLSMVMDRGFYSEANINALYKDHLKFLLAASTSLKLIRRELDQVKDELDSYSNYNENHHVYAMTVTSEWDYIQERPYKGDTLEEKRRIYIHLYFNAEKAAADRTILEDKITALRHELLDGKRVPEHETQYRKYFIEKETPVRGRSVTVNDEAVRKARTYYGYFALVSNVKMDAITALETYRNRDLVEKAFGNLKEKLNLRRTLVSSETSLSGKLFVEFIALIYLSYIKKQMQDNNLFKDYTLQQVLDKLDVIECFENPGDKLRVGEVLSKQNQLYLDLGVTPPTPYVETSL